MQSKVAVTSIDELTLQHQINKILLIDDQADFRTLLRKYINKIRPELQVVEFDPLSQAMPGHSFPWDKYGLVILDYNLGTKNENGLTWMRHFKAIDNMPPVIMLTAEGNSKLAGDIINAGARDFIDKRDVNYEIVKSTLDYFFVDKKPGDDPNKPAQLLFQDDNLSGNEITEKPQPRFEDIEIPGYEIIREIGRGGMSIVFLAKPDIQSEPVVLKLMFTDNQMDDKALKRFLQEYNLISALDHPNVVNIYERAFASNFAYIAMEYFPGGDLSSKLKKQLPLSTTTKYIKQISHGLAAIHGINVVHRDIKPGNILFRDDDTLTITDFGAAKNRTAGATDITLNHGIVGTPYYMSPEQVTGMQVDSRSDLYSLGILVFQMLSGEKPFMAKSIPQLISMHIHSPVPKLPAEMAQFQPLIDGLLAKDPNERFQSAEDVVTGLEWLGY